MSNAQMKIGDLSTPKLHRPVLLPEERERLIRDLEEENKRISSELQWLRSEQMQISEDVLSLGGGGGDDFGETPQPVIYPGISSTSRTNFGNADYRFIDAFRGNYQKELGILVERQRSLSERMQSLNNIRLELMANLKRLNDSNQSNYVALNILQRQKQLKWMGDPQQQSMRMLHNNQRFSANCLNNPFETLLTPGEDVRHEEARVESTEPPPPPAPNLISKENNIDKRITDFYENFPAILTDVPVRINPNFGVHTQRQNKPSYHHQANSDAVHNNMVHSQGVNPTILSDKSPIISTFKSRINQIIMQPKNGSNLFKDSPITRSFSLERKSPESRRSILKYVEDTSFDQDTQRNMNAKRIGKNISDHLNSTTRNVVWLDQVQDRPSCSDESGIDSLTQSHHQQNDGNDIGTKIRRKLPKEPKDSTKISIV